MKKSIKTILFFGCCLVTIAGISYLYCYRRHFWDAVSGIATVWLIFVAYDQLGDSNRTSRADFIRRFADKFFNEPTRDLLMLLDCEALSFQDTGPFPYFVVDEKAVRECGINEEKKRELLDRKKYSAYEMDDCLLGYLEDIGFFEKRGLINIEEVNSHFNWYIQMVWDNPEIQKYVQMERKEDEDSRDKWENLEALAKRLRHYRQTKKRRQ
jgi:hypothetical protein